MKQNFRCAFLLFSTLFLTAAQGLAQTFKYTFDTTNKTATVTGIEEDTYAGEITIPGSTVSDGEDYQVTSIGDNAFESYSGLTKVSLPSTITSIGNYAFHSCSKLATINLIDGLETIGSYAFDGCGKLGSTGIVMPNTVTSIGESVFNFCGSLSSITLSNKLNKIPIEAFRYCRSLKSVVIPNSVKVINKNAFDMCSNLATISIPEPNSSLVIAQYAFLTTKFYQDQTDGPIYIGDKVFLAYKGAMPEDYSLVIKRGTTIIADEACINQTNLTSFKIPETLTAVGNNALLFCDNLKTATIITTQPPYINGNLGYELDAKLYCVDPIKYADLDLEEDYGFHNIEKISYDVKISSVGYSTFSAPLSTIIPSGVKAYKAVKHEVNASDPDLGTITFEPLIGTIPPYCGVLLIGKEGSYKFELNNEYSKDEPNIDEAPEDNMLSETGYDVTSAGTDDYVLSVFNDDETGKPVVAFYIAQEGLVIPENKAYFHLSKSSGVKGFVFSFATPTGVNNAPMDANSHNIYFDLNGKRELHPQKGNLYIMNGKATIKN